MLKLRHLSICALIFSFASATSFAGTQSIADFSHATYGKKCLANLHYPKSKPSVKFNCTKDDDGLCIMLEKEKVANKLPTVKCQTEAPVSKIIQQDLTVYKLNYKGFVKK